MLFLLYLLIAGMILLCVLGVALALGLFYPKPWITLTVGPWILTTLFFAVECVVPLGRGGLLWGILFCGLSGWFLLEVTRQTHGLRRWLSASRLEIWRNNYALWSFRESDDLKRDRNQLTDFVLEPFGGIILILISTFLYAALWRYPFPDLNHSSEKLTDLMFITSYLSGSGIPAQDYWYAPTPSDHYYSFHHYAAALLGRSFGLSPGLTYNYSFCLLVSLVATTGIGAIATFSPKTWVRILCSSALLFGGFGDSGLIHLLVRHVTLYDNVRFVGCLKCDVAPLGTWLQQYASKYQTLQLPGEPFSYSIYVGDYHAPLAGLYLLFILLLALGEFHLGKSKQRVILLGIAAATLPWCLISNTWSMPLQGLLFGSWFAYQLCCKTVGKAEIVALLAGGGGVLILLLGYISRFILTTSEYTTAMRLVPYGEHTPPLLLLLFLFPVIVTIALSAFSRNIPVAWIGLFWLCILAFTELFYVDDIYYGQYERFNSTLKWWPWLNAGVVCCLAPLVLTYARPFLLRVIVGLAIGYPCLFAVDLVHFWWNAPQPNAGSLTGDAYLKKDPATNALYNQLKALPMGLTVERPEGVAYTNMSALALMSGKPCWLGWVSHEQGWRKYPPELAQRFDKLTAFYNNTSPDVEWLWANRIVYILWYKPGDTEANRLSIDPLLADHYRWVETLKLNDRSTGYWVLTDY